VHDTAAVVGRRNQRHGILHEQGATDGDDDSVPASTVRTRYERMLKERERRLEGDPDTPGGSQVRSCICSLAKARHGGQAVGQIPGCSARRKWHILFNHERFRQR